MYIVHCTLYSVQCTLYIVHCTLYIVHCTVYTLITVQGADVHRKARDGRTPLHMAAIHGRLSRVQALLSHQASVTFI